MLDTRSLSLFRICLGLITTVFAYRLLFVAQDFLRVDGFLPREILRVHPSIWSLHFITNNIYWQYTLLWAIIIAALLFTIGYKTKVISIVLWLLLISLHFRIHPILNSGAIVQYTLYLWAFFLPIDTHFTYKNITKGIPIGIGTQYTSWVNFSFVSQLAIIFVFSVFFKIRSEHWLDGTAVYRSIHSENYVSLLGLWFQFVPPLLLKLSTYIVLFIELFAPLFILISFFQSKFSEKIQGAGVAQLLLLSTIFGTLFSFGVFPFVMLTATIACIPSSWWNKIIHQTTILKEHSYQCIQPVTQSLDFTIGSLLLLGIILYGNLHEYQPNNFSLHRSAQRFIYTPLKLHQKWSMYAQESWQTHWFAANAITQSSQKFDTWKWFNKKQIVPINTSMIPNKMYAEQKMFWKNYIFYNLIYNSDYQRVYAQNICKLYNQEFEDTIKEIEFYQMNQTINGVNKLSIIQAKKTNTVRC